MESAPSDDAVSSGQATIEPLTTSSPVREPLVSSSLSSPSTTLPNTPSTSNTQTTTCTLTTLPNSPPHSTSNTPQPGANAVITPLSSPSSSTPEPPAAPVISRSAAVLKRYEKTLPGNILIQQAKKFVEFTNLRKACQAQLAQCSDLDKSCPCCPWKQEIRDLEMCSPLDMSDRSFKIGRAKKLAGELWKMRLFLGSIKDGLDQGHELVDADQWQKVILMAYGSVDFWFAWMESQMITFWKTKSELFTNLAEQLGEFVFVCAMPTFCFVSNFLFRRQVCVRFT